MRKPGKRDAESRPSENLATGEPCAWKSRKHGSGRGGWKRTRSRLAVTANGRINELRHKPRTSPAAYSTESQSPAVQLSHSLLQRLQRSATRGRPFNFRGPPPPTGKAMGNEPIEGDEWDA